MTTVNLENGEVHILVNMIEKEIANTRDMLNRFQKPHQVECLFEILKDLESLKNKLISGRYHASI